MRKVAEDLEAHLRSLGETSFQTTRATFEVKPVKSCQDYLEDSMIILIMLYD